MFDAYRGDDGESQISWRVFLSAVRRSRIVSERALLWALRRQPRGNQIGVARMAEADAGQILARLDGADGALVPGMRRADALRVSPCLPTMRRASGHGTASASPEPFSSIRSWAASRARRSGGRVSGVDSRARRGRCDHGAA
jgi:hypothetical protein